MHNPLEQGAVDAVDLFVDFLTLNPQRFGVGKQLVSKFVETTSAFVVSGTLLASHWSRNLIPRLLMTA